MNKRLACKRCGHEWTPRSRSPVQCPSCHSAWWRRPRTLNPRKALLSFKQAFTILNDLQRRQFISGWAIYGAVGYMYYEEVIQTRNIDIFVEVSAETEMESYAKVLREFEKYGPMVNEAAMFQVGNVLIQVFPSTGHPLWEDVVHSAVRDNVSGEPVKVASKEHLIILALARFHPTKDVPRIGQLHGKADKRTLHDLLRRFDAHGSLAHRLARVTEWIERN